MKKSKKDICKFINTKFRNWYFSNPSNKIRSIRELIISDCEIDEYKWKNWISGKSTPNKYELEIINKIAGKQVF